jgi:hypothetical protein
LSRLKQKVFAASMSITTTDPTDDRSVPEPPLGTPTPDLRAEAVSEVGRVALRRALSVPGDEAVLALLDGGRWWTTKARRTILAGLGGRSLFFFRAHLVDEAGGIAASRLIVLASLQPFVDQVSLNPSLDHAIASWSANVEAIDRTFWETRARREQWIVRTSERQSESLYQPGLFDRRSERHRVTERATRVAFREIARARLEEVGRRSSTGIPSVDLMLVLHP